MHFVRDLDIASGGPSRSIPALADTQAANGARVDVCYQDRGNPVVDFHSAQVDYRVCRLSGLNRDLHSILDQAQAGVVFHLHGIWDPFLHVAARFARRQGIPYVVSLRGMLSAWCLKHKYGKKKLAWWLYQKRDLQQAARLLATSTAEQQDIRRNLPEAQIEVIPNGCFPMPSRIRKPEVLDAENGVRWAAFIGRLHPVKGLEMLIQAWSRLQPGDWKLLIAGPDEDGYRKVLDGWLQRKGLTGRVRIIGALDEYGKWGLLQHCEVLVAPSISENFGMVIAEALESATPVITTTGTPWPALAELDCGWWVEAREDALLAALRQATKLDRESLAQMGRVGKRYLRENFSWDRIAGRTLTLYDAVGEAS